MYVVGICGSPREFGNTRTYLDIALEEASKSAETRLIWLGNKSLRGCRGCYECVKTGQCAIQDDFQEIFSELLRADGILLGSPAYHASITSEMKALLDRAGFSGRWAVNAMKSTDESYSWKNCAFSGKVVAPVTVARRTGQALSFAELLIWATCNDCIVVGNSYWNVGVAGKGGAINAQDDAEGVEIMRGLAKRMVHVISRVKER
jgi:multimeric flavodoxin WrbA